MSARRKPSARVSNRVPNRLAHVELPSPIEIQLTKAQMKALAPLFAAARETYERSEGIERGAIYAQPFERGALKAGYLRPHEATLVHAVLMRIADKRAAALAKGGRR